MEKTKQVKQVKKTKRRVKPFNGMYSDVNKTQKIFSLPYIKNRDNGFKAIISFIEERTGITYEQMSSNSRKRELSDIRCLFYHLGQKYLDASSVSMGKYMNRDHATVLHAIANIHPMLAEVDKGYIELLGGFSQLYTRESFSIRSKNDLKKDVETSLSLVDKNRELNEEIVALKKEIIAINSRISQSESLLLPIINKIPEDKLYIAKERIEAMVYMMTKS